MRSVRTGDADVEYSASDTKIFKSCSPATIAAPTPTSTGTTADESTTIRHAKNEDDVATASKVSHQLYAKRLLPKSTASRYETWSQTHEMHVDKLVSDGFVIGKRVVR